MIIDCSRDAAACTQCFPASYLFLAGKCFTNSFLSSTLFSQLIVVQILHSLPFIPPKPLPCFKSSSLLPTLSSWVDVFEVPFLPHTLSSQEDILKLFFLPWRKPVPLG